MQGGDKLETVNVVMKHTNMDNKTLTYLDYSMLGHLLTHAPCSIQTLKTRACQPSRRTVLNEFETDSSVLHQMGEG